MNNFKIYTNGEYDIKENIKYKLNVKKQVAIENLKDLGTSIDIFFTQH